MGLQAVPDPFRLRKISEMTIDTMAFTADDGALAVNLMVDAAMDDVPFTTLHDINAITLSTTMKIRKSVLTVLKMHGITSLGDDCLGEESAARAIIRECGELEADPDAYLKRLGENSDQASDDGKDPEDAPVVAAPVTAAAQPADQPFGLIPQVAVTPAAAPQPAAKIRFVDQPAKALFPGMGARYDLEMVPTAKWLTAKPTIPEPDRHYSFPGFQTKVMISAVRRRKNVVAVGDPGCGKTEFFKQFGYAIGLPVHVVPFDGSLNRAEIIGSFRQVATPTGSATPFIDGLLPTFIQQPCIIVLDEFDQADPDMQYVLHKLYEGEGITIMEDGGRFVPRHEHCYIVGAANTKGRGSENGLTHARHEMSEATRDRFPYWLNFTYLPPEKESATITAKTGISAAMATKLVTIGTAVRTVYNTGELSQPCSLRQLLDVADLTPDFSEQGDDISLALACEVVMVGRANPDDVPIIREAINQTLNVDLETLER